MIYPRNIKTGERLGDYELMVFIGSDEDISSFVARNVLTNLRLQIDIPHTEVGLAELKKRREILLTLADVPNVRHLANIGQPTTPADVLTLELLPPVSLKQYIKKEGKFEPSKVGEILSQILMTVEKILERNVPLPAISADNVYFAGSVVKIDYQRSVERPEFVKNIAKFIVKISKDAELAKTLVEQLPIDAPDFDFIHSKTRIISLLGKSISGRHLITKDITVKCPVCQTEYVASVGVCKKCNVNLLTGLPIEDESAKKKRKKKPKEERSYAWVLVLSALIALFAVFSKILGISWLLWTVFTGVCFAILVVLFVLVLAS